MMKSCRLSLLALPVLLAPLVAGCVAPRSPAPVPPTAPSPTPRPAPATVADRYQGDWGVADLTPGEWRYVAGTARFGSGDAPVARLSCEGGAVTIARSGLIPQDIAAFVTIRTSFGERRLPLQRADQSARLLMTRLPASDPLFDQIIYSRGRFVIETTMQPPLILPTRPEVARVVEDCRG